MSAECMQIYLSVHDEKRVCNVFIEILLQLNADQLLFWYNIQKYFIPSDPLFVAGLYSTSLVHTEALYISA